MAITNKDPFIAVSVSSPVMDFTKVPSMEILKIAEVKMPGIEKFDIYERKKTNSVRFNDLLRHIRTVQRSSLSDF